MSAPRIEKLGRTHAVEGFDCGKEALNRFLVRHALQSQQSGASNTYLALKGDRVVGFYSLAVGEIAHADAGERLTKGMARHPVPVMLLARLAIAVDCQGQKLGAGLLKDAMVRTLQAADLAGIRALVVHAKDDEARGFYERYGFAPSPSDIYHLHILLKDVRQTVA
ncbi:GNAT family N-acetyltransferase [Nitrospirillum viridazoti]|uniref:GNAT family N-acetyltransferase n=1 Tax=Nitrospirillum viridazoti CBAmc TaxID=1441467 RepID=A0A248JQW4_9PROT|nr:GNAT family N-acetyltransferase [Nitrospirillum amazonense]ASG21143.1 GNAT family N-acetyltransferase [Nitrospirillum amazonense CBAmc]TWB28128.1 acetyltransferase (GNAT) family protein [Nitrospirillum amazonense]